MSYKVKQSTCPIPRQKIFSIACSILLINGIVKMKPSGKRINNLKMESIGGGAPTFAKAHFGHPSPQRGNSLTGLIKIYDALIRPAATYKKPRGIFISGLKWLDAMTV